MKTISIISLQIKGIAQTKMNNIPLKTISFSAAKKRVASTLGTTAPKHRH